jgi:uncharacterized protein (TIGR00251 family)
VAVAAPPVDGAANEEIVAVLAKSLGLSRRAVELVSGQTGRHKRVLCRGLTTAEVLQRLSQGAAGGGGS